MRRAFRSFTVARAGGTADIEAKTSHFQQQSGRKFHDLACLAAGSMMQSPFWRPVTAAATTATYQTASALWRLVSSAWLKLCFFFFNALLCCSKRNVDAQPTPSGSRRPRRIRDWCVDLPCSWVPGCKGLASIHPIKWLHHLAQLLEGYYSPVGALFKPPSYALVSSPRCVCMHATRASTSARPRASLEMELD